MFSHRMWLSSGQFLILGLFAITFIGRVRGFLKEWLPFVLFFLGYEFLRGLISYVGKNANILPMINIDKYIFGFVPTIKLQSLLFNQAHLMWYDYMASLLYLCHLVAPLVAGIYFWSKDKVFFRTFGFAIFVLSYAAFITYIIFPAAPPWIAGNLGYLPPVAVITGVVTSHFLQTGNFYPLIYSLAGGNSFAAMPSLHAAFPLMVFFYLFKWSKKAGILFIPYVLGVWFSVIYLGEHYFIDVVVGALYASVVFILI
jgi:membrane-associated phospholipid phosphatase